MAGFPAQGMLMARCCDPRWLLMALLLYAPLLAAAPQAVPGAAASGNPGAEPAGQPAAALQPAPARAPIRTLEQIEALRPDVDWRSDPFARRDNRFSRRWGGSPSPEEIALQHGGYLMYGITRALGKGGSWLNRVTGGPAQIEHAQARDVPLDDEQIARAARWSQQQGD